ncbi:MAG TPA: hypothetical protein VJV78_08120 [Polyangiales bacterium]|nr:hypothetical protein [Polyangiales bacterium]
MAARIIVAFGLGLSALGCQGAPPAAAEQLPAARAALPSAAPAACGGTGLPDCPLQQWMKATLQTYQREGNFERLAGALDQLKARAPDGYGNWAEVAGNAATAARAKDEAAVRKACKGCHDDHRAKYRRERRNAPWL